MGGILASSGDPARVPPGRGVLDPEKAEAGRPAPDFELADAASGRLVRLSDFRGRPLILNFSATWCITCVAEFASFQRVQEELAGQVTILAVNTQQPRATVVGLIERMAIDQFPVLLDARGEVTAHYRVTGLPTTMLIDGGGRLLRVTQAFMSLEAIAALLVGAGIEYSPGSGPGAR